MKLNELEALVIAQGKKLQEAAEAHMHLVQRADNIVEGFKKELAGRDERLSEMRDHQDGMNDTLAGVVGGVEQLRAWIGADDVDGPFYPEFKALTARLEVLEKLVSARNSSAPTKRNMTDEDALRVLTGDLKDLPHKDAAEKAGLTYAQVYSARLQFTFKHVHKDLRDNVEGWANPWAK